MQTVGRDLMAVEDENAPLEKRGMPVSPSQQRGFKTVKL
jgi:hypothetical protein